MDTNLRAVFLEFIAKNEISDEKRLIAALEKLPASQAEIVEFFLFVLNDETRARLQRAGLKRMLRTYLTHIGSTTDSWDDSIQILNALDENEEDSQLSSWFVSALIVSNKKLPIEFFVEITEKDDRRELRKEFWNPTVGEILRDKYYEVWLNNTEEGELVAPLAQTYSYKVWFNLSLPDEIKELMPSDFQDSRLRAK